MYAWMCRPKVDVKNYPLLFFHHNQEAGSVSQTQNLLTHQGLSVIPRVYWHIVSPTSLFWRDVFSLPLEARNTGGLPCPRLLQGCWASKLQFPLLHGKHFTQWAMSSTPCCHVLRVYIINWACCLSQDFGVTRDGQWKWIIFFPKRLV